MAEIFFANIFQQFKIYMYICNLVDNNILKRLNGILDSAMCCNLGVYA